MEREQGYDVCGEGAYSSISPDLSRAQSLVLVDLCEVVAVVFLRQ